jgi:hypothetical protein
MKNWQNFLNKHNYNLVEDGVIGEKTLSATQDWLVKELSKKSFVLPTKDIVWVRLDNNLTNTFDDIGLRINNKKVDMIFPCSTTAGDYYIFNPITEGGITGTAVACEQQAINSHVFVTAPDITKLWLGGPYFQEVMPIKFYRDGNKDRNIDRGIEYIKNIGLNFHHAGWENFINNWSAACMISQPKYWNEVVKIFNNRDKSTYTLLEPFK